MSWSWTSGSTCEKEESTKVPQRTYAPKVHSWITIPHRETDLRNSKLLLIKFSWFSCGKNYFEIYENAPETVCNEIWINEQTIPSSIKKIFTQIIIGYNVYRLRRTKLCVARGAKFIRFSWFYSTMLFLKELARKFCRFLSIFSLPAQKLKGY